MWNNDDELFDLMRTRLFPAVVGDILDTMGLLKQFLSPGIRALRSDMVIAGRAMPVLETNCFAASEPDGQLPISRQPFGLLFQALEKASTENKVRDAIQNGISTEIGRAHV